MDCIVFAWIALQTAVGAPGLVPRPAVVGQDQSTRIIDLTAPSISESGPPGSGLVIEGVPVRPGRKGHLPPRRDRSPFGHPGEGIDTGPGGGNRICALLDSIDPVTGEVPSTGESQPIPARPRRDYVELRAGPLWSSSSRNRIDRTTFTELELGRKISEHATATLQIDYVFGNGTDGPDDVDAKEVQLLVGGMGRYEFSICEVYAGGGIGLGYGRFRIDTGPIRIKDDAFLGVLNLRGGLRLNLTDWLVLGGEARLNLTSNAKIQGDFQSEKVNMNGYGALLSLGFRF
jgi:hypothetical protein